MEKTTIQINTETLERLKFIKQFERQSYDEVLSNLLDHYEEDEALTEKEIKEINLGLDEIRQGKTTPIEQVAKELGIILR